MKDIYEPARNSRGYHSYIPRQTKPYHCLVCQRRFFEYENLKEHQRRMHTEVELAEARSAWMMRMQAIKDDKLKRQQYK